MSTTRHQAWTNAPKSVVAANKDGFGASAWKTFSETTTSDERTMFAGTDASKIGFWGSTLHYFKRTFQLGRTVIRGYSAPARADIKNTVGGMETYGDGFFETLWGNGRANERNDKVMDLVHDEMVDVIFSASKEALSHESVYDAVKQIVIDSNGSLSPEDQEMLLKYLLLNHRDLFDYIVTNEAEFVAYSIERAKAEKEAEAKAPDAQPAA